MWEDNQSQYSVIIMQYYNLIVPLPSYLYLVAKFASMFN